MTRRRRGQSYGRQMAYNNGLSNGQIGPDRRYEDAEEADHNGNYAWNGQPIPDYRAYDQSQVSNRLPIAGQQPAFMTQARDNGWQSFQTDMPVPGSSGDPNAPYGRRNTGINNADARNVGFQGGYTGYGPNGQPIEFGTFMRDGTQYGKGPHTIDPNKAFITGVHYENGAISAVLFQDGSVADIAQAIGMAEAGLIEDVNTGRNREGQKTLRSYPDGDPSNNLSNLPRF